jgi:hypothetical protein
VHEIRWPSSCGSVVLEDGRRWELAAAKTNQRRQLGVQADILAYCPDEMYVAWFLVFLGLAYALVDRFGSESNHELQMVRA